mgnify:CR=1 FL=1
MRFIKKVIAAYSKITAGGKAKAKKDSTSATSEAGHLDEADKFDWTRDANGGGFTGIVSGKWKAYVLNNGSWTLYKWGDIKYHATGKALSVLVPCYLPVLP